MSQDRLNIKHIAPYLPYGLRVQCEKFKETFLVNGFFYDCYNNPTLSLSGTFRETDGVGYSVSNRKDLSISEVKPLLLPLSALYEEITHNGETFVPYKKLGWENWCDEIGIIVSAEYGENPKVAINVLDFIDDYYKLLEWHIDVFGLIDKGIAIDKRRV